MAELVGSALLSAFFSVLFDKLATEEVKNFLRPKEDITKLLESLDVLRWSADELLDDAEEKLIYNPRVENWHNKLKDVVYKASELADKIETKVLRRKLERPKSASNMTKMLNKFDNYVKNELEEIISSLKDLLSQKDALGLEPAGRRNHSGVKTRVSERSRPTPVADESTFCGREDLKETIFQSLRSADVRGEKMGVIPIIGAGGIGKTTLAQIIYNHPGVKEHFPVRAWVIVSTEFDLQAITKKIIGKVSSSSQIDGNDDELPFKLKDALKGKKFLLVLDDVWSEDCLKWNAFKSYFQSGDDGSKIIVTTRSKKVASIVAPNQPHHELPVLPEEDCLKLFDQTVFSDDQDLDAHRHLQEIGKMIVKKCKGNPLSVTCVGGILCGERDPEKWEKVLESSVWELLQKDTEDIIPSLWLSYRYLPSHLKRCFAYCSIFPKDFLFRKEQMVQLWMAEGFLKNGAGSTMEEVGNQYFEDLISRSLFQRSSDDEEIIMMHDLVHDLALYVSGKFSFWLDEDKTLCDLACETRHLSYNLAIGDAKKFEGLSKAKRLHSFVGLPPSAHTGDATNFDFLKVLEEFSMEGACLRVLSLSSPHYKIDSLLDSVGKLKHLRYLNLSETSVTKLPDSICKLYNLQTLLLSGCSQLTLLPDSVDKLNHLRYLNLSKTSVTELPNSICTLYNLQTLLLSGCSQLALLPDSVDKLKHLRYLNLSETRVSELPDSICTLYNLQTLLLSGCSQLTLLPDSVGKLKHLRYLNLSESSVTELPDSICTLYNLQTLLLSGCWKLTRLPSNLGSLINLRHLDTRGLRLEEMPPKMCNLKKLHTLTDFVLGKQSGSSIKDLGVLQDLHGRIRVSGLQNVNNVDDALEAILKNKKNLSEVALEWKAQSQERDSGHKEKVLEALQPHANLKKLFISEYGGKRFPNWVGDSLFSKIETVHLNNCKDALFLPALGRLPSLKELKIKGFHRVETIDASPFRLLEVLHLEDMPKWKCWSFIQDDKDSVFPRLKDFQLKGCPKLVGGVPNCNAITALRIEKCKNFDFPGNQCGYPSLKSLHIEESCGSMKSFPLDHFPMLNKLVLKELQWLEELTGKLYNELEELFIEKCSNLEFRGNNHYYGSLKLLDIGNCEALKSIPLDDFPKLSLFRFENCQNFESFRFAGKLSLTQLKLKGLPKFVSFPEGGLPALNLKEFSIGECKNLRSLPQQMHRLLPSLNDLTVYNCGEIESWPRGGLPSNLESLEIRGCKKLAAQVKHWGLQTLPPCLKSFEIDGCGQALLDSFPPKGLLPTSLTSLQIRDFRRLKTLNIHACQHLEYLYLYDCPLLEPHKVWCKTSHIRNVEIDGMRVSSKYAINALKIGASLSHLLPDDFAGRVNEMFFGFV